MGDRQLGIGTLDCIGSSGSAPGRCRPALAHYPGYGRLPDAATRPSALPSQRPVRTLCSSSTAIVTCSLSLSGLIDDIA